MEYGLTTKEDRDLIASLFSDAEWIRAIGEALYGHRWQRQLAQAMGLSSGYISRLMSEDDDLGVSDAFRDRLLAFVDEEMPRRLAAWQFQSALLSAAASRYRR